MEREKSRESNDIVPLNVGNSVSLAKKIDRDSRGRRSNQILLTRIELPNDKHIWFGEPSN